MVQVSYPGVYVQEVSSGSRTITGVSTSIAMFVGRTDRGVMNKPTRLFNYTDFVRTFGQSSAKSELATAVRLFFNNGGTQAYVLRIANGATKATVTLLDSDDAATLKLDAREDGSRGGEIRVAVDYNTLNPATTFNLHVFRVDPTTLQESEVEHHTNLSMTPGNPRYVLDVIQQNSALVTATKLWSDSTDGGFVTGARIVSGAATGADSVASILTGSWTVAYELDGTPHSTTFNDGNLDGAMADVTLTYPVVVAATSFLVTATADNPVTLRFLPSGAVNDVATALQLTPELGGIESQFNADKRPRPSGVVADGYTNPNKVANLDQSTNLSFTGLSATIDGFNAVTSSGKYYDGGASSVPSLRNVREKLDLIATRFNTAAVNKSVTWRAEVQGYSLVFRPTTGNANAGAGTVIAEATLIGVNALVLDSDNGRYYMLDLGGVGHQASGANGLDGAAPLDTDYAAAYDVIRREVDLFNILILPRDPDIDDDARIPLWGPASTFCQERRAFLLIDPPNDWKTVDDITGGTHSIATLRQGVVKDHAGVYFPRIQTTVDGFIRPVDPSGAIAGIMARIDANRGVWKAPAGIEADLRAISGVERQMSDPENGVINSLAVNAVRVFPNGIITWGARTMDGFDNSGNDDYKYVPVRRLALYIGESLARGLKFAVFEPNDEPLWAQIRLAAGAFMNNLFRQGAFQGQKKSDAYFVKVDNETTTQNDINLGIVNVVVGFAPLKPAEFVVVTIQQIAGQVQI